MPTYCHQSRNVVTPKRSGWSTPHKRTRNTEHFRRFWSAWIEGQTPWTPTSYFSYYKVTGPKQLRGIGSSASIALQVFFVSIEDHKEYCLCPPMHCKIEILSQKPVAAPSGAKRLSIEAMITSYQDKAFFIKFPAEQASGRSSDLLLPDQKYQKFHMIYDPKARTDGQYRGIIDYWYQGQQPTLQYNPPKYRFGNCLIDTNHLQQISYHIDNPDNSLSDITDQSETVLIVTRRTYTLSGKTTTTPTHTFLLHVRPTNFIIPDPNPRTVPATIKTDDPDHTYTTIDGIDYIVGPDGSRVHRESYENFQKNFQIMSYTLAANNDYQIYRPFHFTSVITRPPELISQKRFNQYDLEIEESQIFAPGNIIEISGFEWTVPDPSPQFLPHIDRISGHKLPEIGIFPYCPKNV